MKKSEMPDPFKEKRENEGYHDIDDQNDPVKMVLGHKDVRKAAHNWKTFQSGAEPGRIVVPSEVEIRDLRQIPFEVDPPEHKSYRDLVEPWFKRPLEEEYQAKLKNIIAGVLDEAIEKGSVEVIHDFSLVLQSRALTVLLNSDYSEAERWISWGTHVFRSEDDPLDNSKANVLADYLDEKVEEAKKNPTEDFFSVLLNSEVDGKKLSDDEVKGVMMLTFAGGRDTVINAVTNSIAYFADHPESIEYLRKQPEHMNTAIEELVRYFSPLTHMGRVATEDTAVCEHAVKKDSRISMCWASANRDERVFEKPNEVVLDRQMNPHVGFGFGTHNCLGATHARTILKILLEQIIEKIGSMEILDSEDNIEDWGGIKRKVGYHNINVKLTAL
ncbi:cytochrome P450 [Labilibacter marinus]|uniref:cytochrome P450 n=1 Tax=Labilibacter marinus TaxID=1477105 RepID=UPI0008304CA3|nr:cytochrome P450 [Labilibacter marinus]